VAEEELFNEAYRLAPVVKGRAADLYYIAVAHVTCSMLLSSDRRQIEGAKRAGVKAYYVVGEIEHVLEDVRKMKALS